MFPFSFLTSTPFAWFTLLNRSIIHWHRIALTQFLRDSKWLGISFTKSGLCHFEIVNMQWITKYLAFLYRVCWWCSFYWSISDLFSWYLVSIANYTFIRFHPLNAVKLQSMHLHSLRPHPNDPTFNFVR